MRCLAGGASWPAAQGPDLLKEGLEFLGLCRAATTLAVERPLPARIVQDAVKRCNGCERHAVITWNTEEDELFADRKVGGAGHRQRDVPDRPADHRNETLVRAAPLKVSCTTMS